MTPRTASVPYHHHAHHGKATLHKIFFGLMMFTAAYMTTITVNAQEPAPAGDVIQLNSNSDAVFTGTVKEADENWVIIDSAGKEMKIVLDDVKMKGEADTVFSPGMMVSVDGEITGDDFGVPLVKARSITATENPDAAVAPASKTMVP